jgi:hypothetical protein
MKQENLVVFECLKIEIYFWHFLDSSDNHGFLYRIFFLKKLYTPQNCIL